MIIVKLIENVRYSPEKLYRDTVEAHLTIVPWARVVYEVVNRQQGPKAERVIINLAFNNCEWNDSFIKFLTFAFSRFNLIRPTLGS